MLLRLSIPPLQNYGYGSEVASIYLIFMTEIREFGYNTFLTTEALLHLSGNLLSLTLFIVFASYLSLSIMSLIILRGDYQDISFAISGGLVAVILYTVNGSTIVTIWYLFILVICFLTFIMFFVVPVIYQLSIPLNTIMLLIIYHILIGQGVTILNTVGWILGYNGNGFANYTPIAIFLWSFILLLYKYDYSIKSFSIKKEGVMSLVQHVITESNMFFFSVLFLFRGGVIPLFPSYIDVIFVMFIGFFIIVLTLHLKYSKTEIEGILPLWSETQLEKNWKRENKNVLNQSRFKNSVDLTRNVKASFEKRTIPSSIKLLVIFQLISSIINIFIGSNYYLAALQLGGFPNWVPLYIILLIYALILSGIITIFTSSLGLFMKSWSRNIMIFGAIAEIIVPPLGSLTGVISLWYLRKPEVKEYFLKS